MESLAKSRLAAVPGVAVFDVDETLIRTKSMFDFMTFAYCERDGIKKGRDRGHALYENMKSCAKSKSREEVNRDFYRVLTGWREEEVRLTAARWFSTVNGPALYHETVVKRLREHQMAGDLCVLLSGSARLFLEPLAHFLRVDELLAVGLEVDRGGCLTGEIKGIQTIGYGKRTALQAFLKAVPIDACVSGYGDHVSDLPFLELCDRKTVIVHPETVNQERSWFSEFEKILVD